MDSGSSTTPSWRSGNTHGFCVTGGRWPIASEPTPSPRLWATAPGATPVRLCEHTTRLLNRPSEPELSTWMGTGTFYLAPTVVTSRCPSERVAYRGDSRILLSRYYSWRCHLNLPTSALRGNASDSELRCSFCHKWQDDVGKLISSPSDNPRAYICNECIA